MDIKIAIFKIWYHRLLRYGKRKVTRRKGKKSKRIFFKFAVLLVKILFLLKELFFRNLSKLSTQLKNLHETVSTGKTGKYKTNYLVARCKILED